MKLSKLLLLPLFVFLCSCSNDEEMTDDIYGQDFSSWNDNGIPSWLEDSILDRAIYDFGKWVASSYWRTVKRTEAYVHELNNKKFISIYLKFYLILNETYINSYNNYDYAAGYFCYTPDGTRILDESLIEQIMSSPKNAIIESGPTYPEELLQKDIEKIKKHISNATIVQAIRDGVSKLTIDNSRQILYIAAYALNLVDKQRDYDFIILKSVYSFGDKEPKDIPDDKYLFKAYSEETYILLKDSTYICCDKDQFVNAVVSKYPEFNDNNRFDGLFADKQIDN